MMHRDPTWAYNHLFWQSQSAETPWVCLWLVCNDGREETFIYSVIVAWGLEHNYAVVFCNDDYFAFQGSDRKTG